MNIWGYNRYNSLIWPYCCISWRNMYHQFTIYHREKMIEHDICDLEPSSVYNCMALIVFGQTARLISSSSLVPAGWQAAGQLQQGSMEQVIPHNKCAHTACLSLHFLNLTCWLCSLPICAIQWRTCANQGLPRGHCFVKSMECLRPSNLPRMV